LRVSAHVAISLMLNGRLTIESWKISQIDSLDNLPAVSNYNSLVKTYIDYLTFQSDSQGDQTRMLTEALTYISLLVGESR
jgi:hypothetical protein